MSLLARSFATENASPFTPIFHLLDDFNTYQGNTNKHHRSGVMKSFNPKFDVREIADAYELHGELPGIDQKDIDIEFTDAQTLHIKGRTERSYSSGTPQLGEGDQVKGTIEQGEKSVAHKATVEDEDEGKENTSSTVVQQAKQTPKVPESRFWVSERSIGEFARSFTFPVRVDQDAVTASMKNGILSIVVPKSKKVQGRKIVVN